MALPSVCRLLAATLCGLAGAAVALGQAAATNLPAIPVMPATQLAEVPAPPALHLGEPQPVAAQYPDRAGKEKEPEGKKNPEPEKEPEKGKTGESTEEKEAVKIETPPAKPPWYSAHVQTTIISQGNWLFPSPYEGQNSFLSQQQMRTSETATLFLAARLWQGTEIIFNPEIAGGQGLSDVFGMAGYPNGEITRVGRVEPTPYIARLYLRQTFELGGEWEKLEDAPNQVAGHRDQNRLTISVGRLPATDGFDDNRYSHDPRTQFMNWGLMYNAAWDYPANVRGYNYGLTVELNQPVWAIRWGVWQEPVVANGAELDSDISQALGQAIELEYRYDLGGLAGRLRLLAFLNRAHMGDYREALEMMPVNPDITATRQYRYKYGFGLNVQQEVTRDLGLFARLGWDDGHTETWAFTECDRTASIGMLLNGRQWQRPQDQVGLGLLVNGLSMDHRHYLAAGGLGFELGDGQLNYGFETIIETFYNWEVRKGIYVALDFQEVWNPGYNRDRGPVSILAMRVHFEF
jgi:high affinity Mn2+ porin